MKKLWRALAIALLVAGLFVAPAAAATAQSGCGDYYVVQPGEYLTQIAAKCGVTVNYILARNPQIWNANLVYYGTVLRLTGDPYYPPIPVTGGYHVVQYGDTMYQIALQHGVYYWDLVRVNPYILNPWWIYPGQIVYLPVGSSEPPVPPVPPIPPVPTTGGNPAITLSGSKIPPGGSVTVSATGFPANTSILIQAGKQGDGYVVSVNGTTDADGKATAVVTLSPTATLNEVWILLVQTTGVFPSSMAISPAITITSGE